MGLFKYIKGLQHKKLSIFMDLKHITTITQMLQKKVLIVL